MKVYQIDIQDLSRKIEPLLIYREQHQCNLAVKDSGLECACVNNDVTALVSGAVDIIE